MGDSRNLSSSLLGGWQGTGGFGVGLKAIAGGSINGGVDVGFSNGKATTGLQFHCLSFNDNEKK